MLYFYLLSPSMNTERHPLQPFMPEGARVLMLGSFPPKRERWSMEFFYPNFINDMWRIIGLIFFDDKHNFEIAGKRCFDKERIVEFCSSRGLALYDTATEVRRLKDNASDKFLEVVSPTNLHVMLEQLPECRAIVTTGEKASIILSSTFGCELPRVGEYVDIQLCHRTLHFWRMPSSSRAYPLSLDKKAEQYRKMFTTEGVL